MISAALKPVYETLAGWKEEITACRSYADLPANAKAYLRRISELVGRPIEHGVGRPRAGPNDLRQFDEVGATMAGEVAPPTLEVPTERRPRHIAIIMDGNGRWAERQNLPRVAGHQRGVESVRRTTEECARLKIEQLTLYCLSSENWKRPQTEISFLMHLLEQYMIEERSTIMENNIRVRMLGRRDEIPDPGARRARQNRRDEQTNTGMWLNLAINYGGRAELVDAVREIGHQIANRRPDGRPSR